MKYSLLFLPFSHFTLYAAEVKLDIKPDEYISAIARLNGNDTLSITIFKVEKILNTDSFDVSSEKKNHILYQDYNLDGYIDLSVWHLNEGMASYKLYRIFLFDKIDKRFKEVFSECGGGFLNIKIEGTKLINTYFADNTPKICHINMKSLQ